MKKFVWFVLILWAFLAPEALMQSQPAFGAGPSGTPQQTQGRKKRIAVFDFDYATVTAASSQVLGANVDLGKGISDLLVKHLVQDGTYSIIERKAMDKIMQEQNFSPSEIDRSSWSEFCGMVKPTSLARNSFDFLRAIDTD